jgi:hypothetical protein
VSLLRRSAAEGLSMDWRSLSPPSRMGLKPLLTCGPARPVVVGWHGRRQGRLCRSTALRFLLSVELSRLIRPVRGRVFGTMPADHLFSIVRRLSGTEFVSRTDPNLEDFPNLKEPLLYCSPSSHCSDVCSS